MNILGLSLGHLLFAILLVVLLKSKLFGQLFLTPFLFLRMPGLKPVTRSLSTARCGSMSRMVRMLSLFCMGCGWLPVLQMSRCSCSHGLNISDDSLLAERFRWSG